MGLFLIFLFIYLIYFILRTYKDALANRDRELEKRETLKSELRHHKKYRRYLLDVELNILHSFLLHLSSVKYIPQPKRAHQQPQIERDPDQTQADFWAWHFKDEQRRKMKEQLMAQGKASR